MASACAGGAGKPSEHAPLPTAAVAPPTLPEDPMALVPLDAVFVASAQLDAVEQAPSFATWRSWATQYGCTADADIAWLTSKTSRVVAAGRDAKDEKGEPELLLILEGTFDASDRERALVLIAQRMDQSKQAAAAARSERTQGHYAVLASGLASAAVLDGRLLLVGSDALLNAAIELVEHPPATHYVDSEPFKHMSARVDCDETTVCVVAAPDSRAARLLKRELGSVGMKSVGKSVAAAPTSLSVDLSSGLALHVSSELKDADETTSVVKQLNDWIWQLDIIARLAGLTDVLDEIKVKADGVHVEVRMQLPPDALSKLERRLSSMLEGTSAKCGAAATQDPPPTAAPVNDALPPVIELKQ